MTMQDTKALRIAGLALLVVSVVCTQIPLLNYLGFEYSLLMALVASLVSGLLHLSFVSRLTPGSPFARFILRSFGMSLFLLVIPVGVSSLNALAVQNCSFTQGGIFFLLLVLPAVFFSISLAAMISTLTGRWRKTWFVFIVGIVLLQVLYVTITRPQIFAFNYVLGFFPGVTYDETLRIETRLLLFRVETVCAGLFMLGVSRLVDGFKRRPFFASLPEDPATRKTHVRILAALILVAGLGWGSLFYWGEALGLKSSSESIEKALGGRIEGDRVIVVYSKETLTANDAQKLLDLHEFLVDELVRDLQVSPRKKITSFVYPTAYEKGFRVGAAGTNIAKPWLWQLHVNVNDVEAVLKHELVHIMASDFGFVLFRVGRNPGLIEGLAVAVERESYGESLHRLARSVELLGGGIELDDLFSISGFVRAQASVGYTLAGSFCRFLIDRYGMRRFKRLYRSGSFEEVYRKPIGKLESEWRAMLRSIQPTEAELEKAAYLFRRPTIFGKVCVRVLADLNAQARTLLARGSADSALEVSRRSIALSPTPEAVIIQASALLQLGRYEELVSFAYEQLKDSSFAHRLLPLRRSLGIAEWALGDYDRARDNFDLLIRTRITPAWAEDAALQREAMGVRESSDLIPFFSGAARDTQAVRLLNRVLKRTSADEPLLRYLLGLAYDRIGMRDSALVQYARSRFRDPLLAFSRVRRMGLARFATGQYQQAKMHFWEARNYSPSSALELELDEWIRRCDWMTEKARSDPFIRTKKTIITIGAKLIFAQIFHLLASQVPLA